MSELEALKQRVAQLEKLVMFFTRADRYKFNLNLDIGGGHDIILSGTRGTKIGTSPTQKLAFFGSTPVVQQGTISDPSGGAVIDSEARSAINSILDVLDAYGLTA